MPQITWYKSLTPTTVWLMEVVGGCRIATSCTAAAVATFTASATAGSTRNASESGVKKELRSGTSVPLAAQPKRYARNKSSTQGWIFELRPLDPLPPSPLLYRVYNSHDIRGKYPFLAVRFQIYFVFQYFLLVSMTGWHSAVSRINDNTWVNYCKC